MNIFFDTGNILFGDELKYVIRHATDEALNYFGLHKNIELSVCIVDEAEIKSLNNEHRKIDKITDVLSFPLLNREEISQAFSKGDTVFLGDVVICFQRARKQAEEYNHSIERETAFLTVHSILHLLGYDHLNYTDEEEMFDIQEEILKAAGYLREEI